MTIVQLIALFYKDQHVENMQKLLGTWINATTSESSEDDDESNTSPPVRRHSALLVSLIDLIESNNPILIALVADRPVQQPADFDVFFGSDIRFVRLGPEKRIRSDSTG